MYSVSAKLHMDFSRTLTVIWPMAFNKEDCGELFFCGVMDA